MRRSLAIALGLVALLGFIASCGQQPAQPQSDSQSEPGSATWMETTFANHPEWTLGQMLIPGTHDSGTSQIQVNPPCTKELIAGQPTTFKIGSDVDPCVVAGMARSQDQNFDGQLRGGVRYLDMRVGVPADQLIASTPTPSPQPEDPLSVPLVLQHSFVSQPLNEGLSQILEFVAKHPREQIILDFQHFDLPGPAAVNQYYVNALNTVLHDLVPRGNAGRSVCDSAWSRDVITTPDAQLSSKVTLKQVWDANKSIVVLFPKGVMPADPCYRNRDVAIMSLWPNTEDPATSLSYNLAELKDRKARLAASPQRCTDGDGNNWCGFYVSQVQLTFQDATAVECAIHPQRKCSLYAYSQLINNGMAGTMTNWRMKQKLPVNIIIVDYYNLANPSIVDAFIEMNRQLVAG